MAEKMHRFSSQSYQEWLGLPAEQLNMLTEEQCLKSYLLDQINGECLTLRWALKGDGFGRPIMGVLNYLENECPRARDLLCAYLVLTVMDDPQLATMFAARGSLRKVEMSTD